MIRAGGTMSRAASAARQVPSDFLPPHHDAEPAFPIPHEAILTRTGCACELRQIYGDGLPILRLTTQSVYPARSLLDHVRIQRKIVMNDSEHSARFGLLRTFPEQDLVAKGGIEPPTQGFSVPGRQISRLSVEI
jgi:hypothetical protein